MECDLPAVVDGTSVDTGTPFDAAFRDGCKDAIDAVCHSATNPLESCSGIQDEVVAARGDFDTLGERMGVSLLPDGTLVDGAAVTPVQGAGLVLRNFFVNDLLEGWSQGDTSAPDGWELTGAGATIVRTGAGLADTQAPLTGRWCAKVTAGGGAAAYLRQKAIPAAVMAYLYQMTTLGAAYLNALGQGKALANVLSTILLVDSRGELELATHSGGGVLAKIGGAPISAVLGILSTDNVYFGYKIAAGQSAHVGPMCPMFGPFSAEAPAAHIPGLVVRKQHVIHFAGNQSTGTRKWAWTPQRPGMITSVQVAVGTAPATQDLIFDLNTWDGAALTSMFSTKPKVVAAATFGAAFAPDGTYARRCFTPSFAALAAGGLVTLDCDQVGVGTVGADASLTINYIEFVRPWDALFPYNQV